MGDCSECGVRHFISSDGKIVNDYYFSIYIHQIYKQKLKVKLKEHPLIIANPPIWTDEDKKRILNILVSFIQFPFIASMIIVQIRYSTCLLCKLK